MAGHDQHGTAGEPGDHPPAGGLVLTLGVVLRRPRHPRLHVLTLQRGRHLRAADRADRVVHVEPDVRCALLGPEHAARIIGAPGRVGRLRVAPAGRHLEADVAVVLGPPARRGGIGRAGWLCAGAGWATVGAGAVWPRQAKPPTTATISTVATTASVANRRSRTCRRAAAGSGATGTSSSVIASRKARSARSGSVILISQLLAEAGQGAVHVGSGGALRTAEDVGDLGEAQVVEKAQHHRGPLLPGQRPQQPMREHHVAGVSRAPVLRPRSPARRPGTRGGRSGATR